MADSIGKLNVAIGVDNAQLAGGLRDTVRLVGQFEATVSKAGLGAFAPVKDSLGKLKSEFRSAERDATRSGISIGKAVAAGLAAGLVGVGANLLGSTIGDVRSLVTDSISIAAEMEKTSIAFEVMTGSAERAADTIKDLRDFAKQSPLTFADSSKIATNLLGAGIDASQVTPTLRMLSDAGRGDKEIISRLAYAYGQVRSAGRLMGGELKQFTETGLPLNEALAPVLSNRMNKPVDPADIKSYVEEGKVGFSDLVNALKDLTSEGGKFAGMTERFGNSFSGQMEQLSDSVQTAKQEFGQALIEELGLKEATQDAGKFADKIKGWVNEARPAIRFVGEAARGTVNVAGELLKGGGTFVDSLARGLDKLIPGISRVSDSVKTIINDAKNFKIDKVKVAETAFEIVEFFGVAFGEFFIRMGEGFDQVYEKNIKPIVNAIDKINVTIGRVDDAAMRVRDTLNKPFIDAKNREEKKTFYRKPVEETITELPAYREVTRRKDAAAAAMTKATKEDRPRDVLAYYDQFLQFEADQKNIVDAYKKYVHETRNLYERQVEDPDKISDFTSGMFVSPKTAREVGEIALERRKFERVLTDFNGQYREPTKAKPVVVPEVDRLMKPFRDFRENTIARLRDEQRQASGTDVPRSGNWELFGQSVGNLATYTNAAADAMKKMKAEVQDPGNLGMLRQEAKAISQQFRPQSELLVERLAKLQELRGAGVLPERDFALAAADAARTFGRDQFETKLPTAAEFGTQGLADSLARATAGSPTVTVEGLLTQLRELEKQQLAAAQAIAKTIGTAVAPVPVVRISE
jgi:tape measure domain-containing protein